VLYKVVEVKKHPHASLSSVETDLTCIGLRTPDRENKTLRLLPRVAMTGIRSPCVSPVVVSALCALCANYNESHLYAVCDGYLVELCVKTSAFLNAEERKGKRKVTRSFRV
jgi:hypothetical protein